jgi:hypothetical protein
MSSVKLTDQRVNPSRSPPELGGQRISWVLVGVIFFLNLFLDYQLAQ